MPRGTMHNVYNRARQRAREEAEFQHHTPAAVLERERRAKEVERRAKEAEERRKGRLNLCSICREFFRSNSDEVGVFVCPSCQNKQAAETGHGNGAG